MSLFTRLGTIIKGAYDRLPAIGHYSEIPAGWIDRMDLEDQLSSIGKFRYFLRKRAIFITMFPVLAAVDMFFSLSLAFANFAGALFTSDEQQESFIKKSREYATLFSKNMIGLLFSFLGIIKPKFVSFFFLPTNSDAQRVKSGGGLYEADVDRVQPETVQDIQDIIKQAQALGQTVMVVGAGRSQGKQFLPHSDDKNKKNILIDMSEFNQIHFNLETKTVKVGAGTKWADLQVAANSHSLALKVMQASNVFSVGGSIGTNIHGWDHRSGNIANIIKSLDIINPQGELEHIDASADKFKQILGGFGLFGVVVSAELELTDNENLEEQSTDVSIEDYVRHFTDNVQTDERVRMHLFRLSLDPENLLGNGVAVNYTKTDDSPPVKTRKIFQEGQNGTRIDRILVNVARRFDFTRKWYWEGEKQRLLDNQTTMTTNEIMQPPINAMFNNSVSESEWLQEYFVPGENLAAFLQELGVLLMENEVTLLNSSVRFVKKDVHSALSYAAEGDRFATVLCFNQSLKMSEVIKTKKWIRQANELVLKHGGSFYLPYQQFASQEQFERSYPQANAFRQAKTEADPQLVFNSGLHQHYIAAKVEKPNYFKALLSSPEAKKEFVGFLENVLQRVDTEKLYALLEDIIKYNDTHEEIYTELTRRLPEIMPNTFSSLGRILGSLSGIKEDLAVQAKALMPDVDTIDGMVEIGYPGRFINGFKKAFKVTGTVTAAYEEQSLTDYIQTGFPRPYDTFLKLDYNAPDLTSIKDNSADVITCYVGLHHFPEDQLAQFLENVRRILRPNGRFLLVDHDAHDEQSLMMANMAHSIFNAVNGVSVEEEMTETRNFRPMAYWQELLQAHGLGHAVSESDVPMIRQGDPSRNTMVSFVKPQPKPFANLGSSIEAENEEDLHEEYVGRRGLTMFELRPPQADNGQVAENLAENSL